MPDITTADANAHVRGLLERIPWEQCIAALVLDYRRFAPVEQTAYCLEFLARARSSSAPGTSNTGSIESAVNWCTTVLELKENLAVLVGDQLSTVGESSSQAGDLGRVMFEVAARKALQVNCGFWDYRQEQLLALAGDLWPTLNGSECVAPKRFCEIIHAIAHRQGYLPRPILDRIDGIQSAASGSLESLAQRLGLHPDEPRLSEIIMGAAHAGTAYEFAFEFLPTGLNEAAKELGVSAAEWNGVISLCNEIVHDHEDSVVGLGVAPRPVIVLRGGRLLVVSPFDVLTAATRIMKARLDLDVHSGTKAAIAQWAETRTQQAFARLFPDGSVFRGLRYPDPRRPGEGRSESDVLVYWPPFVLAIEVKAKGSKLGKSEEASEFDAKSDTGRLITAAADQALRVLEYIESVDCPTFSADDGSTALVIDKRQVLEAYPIAVSLEEIATLSTQVDFLRDLGVYRGDRIPWACTLEHLDALAEAAGHPSMFVGFVRQRILARVGKLVAALDDFDLFELFRNGMLHTGIGDGTDMLMPMEGVEWDQFRSYRVGDRAECPEFEMFFRPPVLKLLRELKRLVDEPAARLAFRVIVCLKRADQEALADAIEQLEAKLNGGADALSATLTLEQLCFTVMVVRAEFPFDLEAATDDRLVKQLTERNLGAGIGFGLWLSASEWSLHRVVYIRTTG